jgi:DNA-binding MarR family transcriptional regulator
MEASRMIDLINRYQEARHTVSRRLDAMVRRYTEEVTTDQFLTLRYIYLHEPCTPSELSVDFCVNKSAVTAILNRLEDKRYIERVRDEKDRRVVYLSLTVAGRNLHDEMIGRIYRDLSRHLQEFRPEELDAFIRTYERLAEVMSREDNGGENQ